jgi:hypothetical protein
MAEMEKEMMKLSRKHIMETIEGAMTKKAHHAVTKGDVTVHADPYQYQERDGMKTGVKVWFQEAGNDIGIAIGEAKFGS